MFIMIQLGKLVLHVVEIHFLESKSINPNSYDFVIMFYKYALPHASWKTLCFHCLFVAMQYKWNSWKGYNYF